MGKSKATASKNNLIRSQKKKNFSRGKILILGIAIILISLTGYTILSNSNKKDIKTSASSVGGQLKIVKADISSTAKFYPYESNGIKMEVFAVKSDDGKIRTAFNTCQVCYDSGKGYYVQDGKELICQNCGNRFKLNMIDVVKKGCNPIPILDEYKSDDGKNILIDKAFLDQNSAYFKNWKTL